MTNIKQRMDKCVLSHDYILEEGCQNTVTKFLKLTTLGKFMALDNRRMNGQSHCCKITRKRTVHAKTDRQHVDGQTGGRTYMIFFAYPTTMF